MTDKTSQTNQAKNKRRSKGDRKHIRRLKQAARQTGAPPPAR
jgi:hypothetical protein